MTAIRSSRGIVAPAALLLALVFSSCGGLARKSSAPVESSGWTELRTPHFTLNTDLDRETAVEVATELEAIFTTLSEVAFHSSQPPRANVDVVHFRREQDYDALAPKRSDAFVLSGTGFDFERRTLVVMHGELVKRTRAVMLHELTHLLVAHYFPQAPIWLNEGFADYYETLAQEGGFTILGRIGEDVRFHRGPYGVVCPPEGCTALVPVYEARALEALLALTPAEFYGDRQNELDPSARADADRASAINRATASSLVRFLQHHPTYQARFSDFLARVRQGNPGDAAWAQTVGRVPADKLEAEFRTSLAPVAESMVLRTEYAPPRRPPESVRELPFAELQMLRAHLWRRSTKEELAAAGAELDRVPVGLQTNPAFVVQKAGWLHAGGQSGRARALLEQVLRDRPGDPRLLSALGYILLEGGFSKADAAGVDAALKSLAQQLAPLSRTAGQDHLVALLRAREGSLALAMAHEKRAISREPNCVPCRAFLAELYDRRGHVADALANAVLADGLLHEGQRWPELREQIRRYRAKLATPGGAKPAP